MFERRVGDIGHEVVVLANHDALEHAPPHSAQVHLKPGCAVGDRADRPRAHGIASGDKIDVQVPLRRKIARGQHGFGWIRLDGGRIGAADIDRLPRRAVDGVDLPVREGQVVAVGAAHERRHLAAPVIGEVGHLLRFPEERGEPRRRPGLQRRVHLLVQAHDGECVGGLFAEDGPHGAQHVERLFGGHGVEVERVARVHRVAVHHGHVQEAHRFERAANDVFGARARLFKRLILDPGSEDDLVKVVAEVPHEQGVGHEHRRSGRDTRDGRERCRALPASELHLHDAVARVVEVASGDGDVVVQPAGRGRNDRIQRRRQGLTDELAVIVGNGVVNAGRRLELVPPFFPVVDAAILRHLVDVGTCGPQRRQFDTCEIRAVDQALRRREPEADFRILARRLDEADDAEVDESLRRNKIGAIALEGLRRVTGEPAGLSQHGVVGVRGTALDLPIGHADLPRQVFDGAAVLFQQSGSQRLPRP